jgi:hypothetical protein
VPLFFNIRPLSSKWLHLLVFLFKCLTESCRKGNSIFTEVLAEVKEDAITILFFLIEFVSVDAICVVENGKLDHFVLVCTRRSVPIFFATFYRSRGTYFP